MQIYGVMQSFISYIQEKFNSIACNVRSFLCLCWYQNDDSQSPCHKTKYKQDMCNTSTHKEDKICHRKINTSLIVVEKCCVLVTYN